MRTWLKVTAVLPGPPDDWSVWAERFSRFGLDGTVQTDDPPTLSAFLPPEDRGALPQLSAELCGLGAKVKTDEVEEVDWSSAWREFFRPVCIGRSLWIRPSWEEGKAPDGRREIVLDPGQAFGTGDHPTTRLCLELLEECDLGGKRFADIGCGSGVLAISAMLLGAAKAHAVDVDPVSVVAARENAGRNGVPVGVFEGTGYDPLPPGAYDVVASNIISAAVIGLAPESADRVATGGRWIVSGIIEPNWPDVSSAVTESGFEVEEWRKEDDWVAAILRH